VLPIKDTDKKLIKKFEIAISSTNINLGSRNLQQLKNLAQEAEISYKALNDLVEVSRD
jgi:hypothetical protein